MNSSPRLGRVSVPFALALGLAIGACASPRAIAEPGAASSQSSPAQSEFEKAVANDVGINPIALARLIDHARAENSDAIIIAKDGKLVIDERFGGPDDPLFAMSASKSVVALAVMHLIERGELALDQSLEGLFPELVDTPKAAITVRQLLNHTSGLPRARTDSGKKISILDQMIAVSLEYPPGSSFVYSNMAVDLLAVVVHRASGKFLDQYLETHVFKPLDITTATWLKDRAGHPLAAGALSIQPVDLAKVGQMIVSGGTWHGSRILTEGSVGLLTAAGQEYDPRCGLFWWRRIPIEVVLTPDVLESWQLAGLSGRPLAAMNRMVGRSFPSDTAFRETLWEETPRDTLGQLKAFFEENLHLPFARTQAAGSPDAFSARGWLGQQLVVVPGSRIVAVRMRAARASDYR